MEAKPESKLILESKPTFEIKSKSSDSEPVKKHRKSMTQQESIDSILQKIAMDFEDVKLLKYISNQVNIHAAYIILGVFMSLFLPIIIGYNPKFFVNLLGFLYPSYMSLTTMEKKDKEVLKLWISYWIVFTFLEILDGVLMLLFSHVLPFYYPIKALFLIWCFYPKSKGAGFLYQKVFRRLYEAIKELKDDIIVDKKTEEFFTSKN